MFTLIITLGIIAAVLITLVVLIQNPKGGGLASNFSAGNQLFGAKQTTEGVEKLTWGLAAIILIVSLSASAYNGSKSAASGSSNSETDKIMNYSPKALKPTQGATK
ncbi:MAG: preprotein translocase subunit SecG [Bacteroidetes bacterium]|nr:preprotein translocase subunit SecG [Bacteroidota bacterium]